MYYHALAAIVLALGLFTQGPLYAAADALETKDDKAAYIYERALAKMTDEERQNAALMYISPDSHFKATYKHVAKAFLTNSMGKRELTRVVVIGGPDPEYTRRVIREAFKHIDKDLNDRIIIYVGDDNIEPIKQALADHQVELRFQTLGDRL